MSFITKFLKNESGATAIEYGLIAALIAVGLIVILGQVGDGLEKNFDKIKGELEKTAQ